MIRGMYRRYVRAWIRYRKWDAVKVETFFWLLLRFPIACLYGGLYLISEGCEKAGSAIQERMWRTE